MNKQQAVLGIIQELLEAIRTAGALPNGHLYAVAMQHGCTLQQWEWIVKLMVSTGLVEQTPAHELRWIGPEIKEPNTHAHT